MTRLKNGQVEFTITVLTTGHMSWADTISDYLIERGYDLRTITTESEGAMLTALREAPVDVIIMAHPHSTPEFLQALRDLPSHSNQSPLLMQIVDELPTTTHDTGVDMLTLPLPVYLENQLQIVLRLREENQVLRKRNQALQDELNGIRSTLQHQKRSTNELETLKNAIVRNVSHELKTPLLQVKSAVALLGEDAQNQDLVNYARGATARLETLVKNITLLGSSLDINPGPVIVRDTIEYAKRNLGRVWEHRDDAGRIQTHLQENLPPILADKLGLSTVLQLLLDNGLKFSKDIVEVMAVHDNRMITISVKDSGIGIAKDQIEAIFDLFYQVDNSSTRRYGGTGVGLAIAQLILDRHDSHIMVESEIGKGSTFSFMLPAIMLD